MKRVKNADNYTIIKQTELASTRKWRLRIHFFFYLTLCPHTTGTYEVIEGEKK